ncbi:Uncharacterised protein [Mycobacteroides abscessus subsp. abscessus]|nr:Uncharacterised protein [Mycobacteroides abscessus subsp. abscessus]
MNNRPTRIDADNRVNAGQHLRDVAHIGAAQRHRGLELGRHRRTAEGFHLLAEHRHQPRIRRQLQIRGRGFDEFMTATGRHGARREAGIDLFLQLAQGSSFDGTHRVLHRGSARNDVGRLAALGDDAVDQLSG